MSQLYWISETLLFFLRHQLLGIVHVLTGPDHLSALATLSANASAKCYAFFLGVRWGVGHSTGLLLVGIVLIVNDYVRNKNNPDKSQNTVLVPDKLTHAFEYLVGVFMICLGIYGLRRAFQKRHGTGLSRSDSDGADDASSALLEHQDHHHDNSYENGSLDSGENAAAGGEAAQKKSSPTGSRTSRRSSNGGGSGEAEDMKDLEATGEGKAIKSKSVSYHDRSMDSNVAFLAGSANHSNHDSPERSVQSHMSAEPSVELVEHKKPTAIVSYHDCSLDTVADILAEECNHNDTLPDESGQRQVVSYSCSSLFQSGRLLSVKSLAFFAGIIHGLAGPGGVLGVIPAVQLHDWRLATVYLGFFCLSSTLTMGTFAVLYGTVSSRLGKGMKLEFQVQCVSACLSLVVGITWIVLLSLGLLEKVFP